MTAMDHFLACAVGQPWTCLWVVFVNPISGNHHCVHRDNWILWYDWEGEYHFL